MFQIGNKVTFHSIWGIRHGVIKNLIKYNDGRVFIQIFSDFLIQEIEYTPEMITKFNIKKYTNFNGNINENIT